MMAPAERSRPFSRIREEFERLLEVPAAARRGELERLAREDAALAAEVVALLAADAAASPLLDGTIERFLGRSGVEEATRWAKRRPRSRDRSD